MNGSPWNQYLYTPEHFCAPFPDATLADAVEACDGAAASDIDCQCQMMEEEVSTSEVTFIKLRPCLIKVRTVWLRLFCNSVSVSLLCVCVLEPVPVHP